MKFEIATDQDQQRYDTYVATHPGGSFLQSWAWGDWQKHNGNNVTRVLLTDNEVIVGAAQIIKTKIPKMNQHYLYIPHGPLYSSPEMFTLMLEHIKNTFPGALFLRIEPKAEIPFVGKVTRHIQPGKTSILDITQTDEQLLARMHHKTRYNIKVAQKHNVEVSTKLSSDKKQIEEAAELLVTTAGRQKYKSHGIGYYQKLIHFFTETANDHNSCTITLYTTSLENELLTAAVMVDFGNTRTYLFGGSSDNKRNVMAPYALHWQAIQDARAAGLTSYDFWGIETASGQTPGFVRFKLGWGGETVQYPPAQDVVYKNGWYKLYSVMRSINRKI